MWPPPHRFAPDAEQVERAGARLGWQNTTVPGATLTFDSDWLRIEGVVPEVWTESAQVTRVRRVGRFFSPGLMFDTVDGAYDGVIVWLFPQTRDRAERLLAARGWPVAGNNLRS
jgi:hypothetical protein